MSLLRKGLKPGDSSVPTYTSEDGLTMAVGVSPTFMVLPKELGGKRANILETIEGRGCRCGGRHDSKVHVLEGDYMVAECKDKGWMWMRKPQDLASFREQVAKPKEG